MDFSSLTEFSSCADKQKKLKKVFADLSNEQTYQKIIEMGRNLPVLEAEFRNEETLVRGCQSLVYLKPVLSENHTVIFKAHADALISAGLAALLIEIYSGETVNTMLKCPPLVLEELKIPALLSPMRAGGLSSILLKMRQECVKFLLLPVPN